MATFSLKYQEKTAEGKMNFIGITHRYFDEINKNNLPKTNDTYIQRYEENIAGVGVCPIETYNAYWTDRTVIIVALIVHHNGPLDEIKGQSGYGR